MNFKEIKWEDHFKDDRLISSNCYIRVYSSIKVEIYITYDEKEDNYEIRTFGYGTLRKLVTERYKTIDEAKTAAYKIYNNEMFRMKKAIDSFIEE